jgi:hypothetical protein
VNFPLPCFLSAIQYPSYISPFSHLKIPQPEFFRREEEGRGKREEGRGKREEGRGKREEGRGKREEGRGKREKGRGKREEGRAKSERKGREEEGKKKTLVPCFWLLTQSPS